MNTKISSGSDGSVRLEKFHRALRRSLSSDEIVDIAQRSARLASEIEQQEEELKTSTKHAKARIDELAAEKRRLELEIVDGGRLEEAQCERRTIYRLGVVQEVRCDTGQILNERPLSDRERQLGLELPASKDDDGDEGADEDGDLSAEDGVVELSGGRLVSDRGTPVGDEDDEASERLVDDFDIAEDPPTEFPSSEDEEPLPTQKKAKAKRVKKAKGA
jgi:hypothetical protein